MSLNAMLAVANLELGRYDLAHGQLQVYLIESRSTRQRHELAFGYLLLSLLATVEQRYQDAEPMAVDARAYFAELNDLDRWALAVAAQGFAAHGLGKADVTRQCFVAALQSSVDHHSFTSITFALAGIALVLVEQGQAERAIASTPNSTNCRRLPTPNCVGIWPAPIWQPWPPPCRRRP